MEIIKARKLKYDYLKYDENGQASESQTAVENVDLDIQPGQFIFHTGTQRFRKIYPGKAYERIADPYRRDYLGGWHGYSHGTGTVEDPAESRYGLPESG